MRRVIMHLDLDAFFCAVEELRNPQLRGVAFVVGGLPDQRGVVSSASYPARKFGIRSAMPTSQALRLCPRLVVVSGHHGDYGEYSQRVMNVLREYTDVLQQISVDEAFFDMTGFGSEPRALALEIQSRIRAEIQLPASIGIATSKLVAKMASGRAKPNGVLLIEEGGESAFMAPMAVEELWGVGAATAERLHAVRIRTIGDLQNSSPAELRPVFGAYAERVIERSRGIDDAPVRDDEETKSISEENTFARDVGDELILRNELLSQSDHVAARLRKQHLFARVVQIKLRWPDFQTITRQSTLGAPTQLGEDIFAVAERLWRSNWRRGEKVRLIGVGVSSLVAGEQISLFDSSRRESRQALAEAVDQLRDRYGEKIVQRASLQKRGGRDRK